MVNLLANISIDLLSACTALPRYGERCAARTEGSLELAVATTGSVCISKRLHVHTPTRRTGQALLDNDRAVGSVGHPAPVEPPTRSAVQAVGTGQAQSA